MENKYINVVMNKLMLQKSEDGSYSEAAVWYSGSWACAEGGAELYMHPFAILQSHGNFRDEQRIQHHRFHLILEGRGEMVCNGEVSVVSAGDFYLFRPDDTIVYYDYPGEPWRFIWLGIHGRLVPWILKEIGLNDHRVHYPLGEKTETWETIVNMESQVADPYARNILPVTAAWSIVDSIRRDLGFVKNRKRTKLAQACRQIIDTQFMSPLSVDAISRQLNVDRTTLFRHFREVYGISPKEYLGNKRLEHAMELLRETDQQVKAIANECGYEAPQYFSRLFRQMTGQSPLEWRKSQTGFSRISRKSY